MVAGCGTPLAPCHEIRPLGPGPWPGHCLTGHALCVGEVGDRRLHSSATEPSSWTENPPLSPSPTDPPSKRYSRYLDSTQGDLALGETTRTRPLNLLNRSCFSRHIREHVSSLVPAHFSTFRHRLGVVRKLREETGEHWAMDLTTWDTRTYRTSDHSSSTHSSSHLSSGSGETHVGGNCGSCPHQLWDPVQVTARSPGPSRRVSQWLLWLYQ